MPRWDNRVVSWEDLRFDPLLLLCVGEEVCLASVLDPLPFRLSGQSTVVVYSSVRSRGI